MTGFIALMALCSLVFLGWLHAALRWWAAGPLPAPAHPAPALRASEGVFVVAWCAAFAFLLGIMMLPLVYAVRHL